MMNIRNGLIWSLSARRAWIEILFTRVWNNPDKSLSARRAWIEMCGGGWGSAPDWRSLSARRAWIEIKRWAMPTD